MELLPSLELRGARRDITVVFFVHGAILSNWVPRIPLIKRELGLDDGALGLALLGAPMAVVVAVRIASWAVGRWDSRAVTRAAAVASCAALVPLALAVNTVSLWAALMLAGGALGLMDVAMNAQGVLVERGYGRPIMSGLHGSYSAGALAGALAGAIAARYDVRPLVHFAAAGAVLAGVVWVGSARLLRGGAEGPKAAEAEPAGKAGPARRSVAGHGGAVLLLGVIGLCSFVGEGAVADWSSVYLREELGASAGVSGLGYAGCAVAMAVGRLSGDRLVARFGPVNTLRVGSLVAGLGLGGGLLAGQEVVAIASFTLFGLGVAPVAPVTFSMAGNLPGTAPATAISRVTGVGYLGLLGGPPAIGFVAELLGLSGALVIPAALATLIVLLAGLVRS